MRHVTSLKVKSQFQRRSQSCDQSRKFRQSTETFLRKKRLNFVVIDCHILCQSMKGLWNDWNYENDVEMTEIEADLFDNQSIKSEVTEIN